MPMLKRTTILLLALLLPSGAFAISEGIGVSPSSEGPHISVLGVGGYNSTWNAFGGLALRGEFPVNAHFTALADAELVSSGVATLRVAARPSFALGPGQLFLDTSVFGRFLGSGSPSSTAEFVTAISAGYKLRYLDAQLGFFSRTMCDLGPDPGLDFVGEPFNLLYRLSFNIMAPDSPWNVGGGVSNFTPYEYERMWQPLFFVNGHYRVSDRLDAVGTLYIKPTGIFHQVASLYGVTLRAGITYSF